MRLYLSPFACSLSPHIVIRELGLPVELVKVDLRTKTTAGGADFTAVNPKGYVPALELDDGQLLTEGAAIVQYLADHKPEAKLAPPNGTMERYRLQEWLNFIATELHKGFGTLFKRNLPAEQKEAARENLSRRLEWLDTQLKGRTFLLGEQFTVADAYLFTVLNWAGFVDVDLSRHAEVQAYAGRVASRPAVKDALQVEGRMKA
ncbi:MAG: glutathione transferase GstA [Myxococcaceae bacterium]|nr:glutathione transferase GstA [Myxococcaceae bacterium]MCI0672713.1 glutathione transferase GstA [Myxococcaceae bacterium]